MSLAALADPIEAEQADLDAEDASQADKPDKAELIIDAGGQLSMIPGGKKATGSTLRIVGGKFTVNGEFKKGTRVVVQMTVEVGAVEFADIKDGTTGQVVACERRHKARPVTSPVIVGS